MVQVVIEGIQHAIASTMMKTEYVHFVQIKCLLLTSNHTAGGSSSITHYIYKSMAYSQGALALGVAVAIGESDLEDLCDADICSNYNLYSSVASVSAGVKLFNCKIMVLGNSVRSCSPYHIGHDAMGHALDSDIVSRAISVSNTLSLNIYNLFAKVEASPSGMILGHHHMKLDDSDINHTRMALVGAVIAAAVQSLMVYDSGGAEHQGPPGGGPLAVMWSQD